MLRLFCEIPNAKGLVSVACCYMKLSEQAGGSSKIKQARVGFPMSQTVSSIYGHELSYEAKELSCHALEAYVQKLREDMPSLKLHCHRAALEVLIRSEAPHLNKPQVRGGKKMTSMSFFDYARAAMDKLELHFDRIGEGKKEEVTALLDNWQLVVVHYTLRVLMAPLVESCILLDRLVFLKENGIENSWIVPIFDPLLSPRNFAIIAMKH